MTDRPANVSEADWAILQRFERSEAELAARRATLIKRNTEAAPASELLKSTQFDYVPGQTEAAAKVVLEE